MWVKRNLVSVYLEIVLISAQDRCIICVVCTSGMEIILGTLMVHQGDMGKVEAHFGPFGDSVSLGAS
jgi:hypothetical protein